MNEFQHLLEVRNLKKHYKNTGFFAGGDATGTRALDGVSFTLDRGETLGLVGESGSGKTTCARCILKLIEPTSGDIYFEGESTLKQEGRALAPLRRKMQMVFQDPYSSLNPRKTVADIVGDPMLVHGIAKRNEIEGKVVELLLRVGLQASQLGVYPHELSGGQRQRVALARALTLSPKLLVCDEPVSALSQFFPNPTLRPAPVFRHRTHRDKLNPQP